ncbi:hypothetical protein AX774_g410 [Zancudomyces culisetae]|uniref:Uncharacterized protein n=1 Tax=Zancudomyces culisetae TaxID=1213189 RepID=A0A1R1PYN0_ZANCU|nr:hypothetical protein AX774_g410 [Zancudomyces culisetae]|eukprot:OMH86029.1 hypothetical protein AX774_g410 [Zancudomyces culisetae]
MLEVKKYPLESHNNALVQQSKKLDRLLDKYSRYKNGLTGLNDLFKSLSITKKEQGDNNDNGHSNYPRLLNIIKTVSLSDLDTNLCIDGAKVRASILKLGNIGKTFGKKSSSKLKTDFKLIENTSKLLKKYKKYSRIKPENTALDSTKDAFNEKRLEKKNGSSTLGSSKKPTGKTAITENKYYNAQKNYSPGADNDGTMTIKKTLSDDDSNGSTRSSVTLTDEIGNELDYGTARHLYITSRSKLLSSRKLPLLQLILIKNVLKNSSAVCSRLRARKKEQRKPNTEAVFDDNFSNEDYPERRWSNRNSRRHSKKHVR